MKCNLTSLTAGFFLLAATNANAAGILTIDWNNPNVPDISVLATFNSNGTFTTSSSVGTYGPSSGTWSSNGNNVEATQVTGSCGGGGTNVFHLTGSLNPSTGIFSGTASCSSLIFSGGRVDGTWSYYD